MECLAECVCSFSTTVEPMKDDGSDSNADAGTCTVCRCSSILFMLILHPANEDSKLDISTDTDCGETPPASLIKWYISVRFLRSILATLLRNADVISRFIARLSSDYDLNSISTITLRLRLDEPLSDGIDYPWDERISSIVYRSMQMECHLWVLSTLGGAFSAMGDYYSHFADRAGRISVRQLQLACDIGDPILISRCKLYIALFLAQKYCFKKAKQIVREEYRIGKQLNSELLVNCCEGVWTKIRWTRNKRYDKKANNIGNGYIIHMNCV